MSNLVKRILAALVLAPLVVFIIYYGGIVFLIAILLLFAVMMYEWTGLIKKFEQKLLWWLFGFFYLGFACLVMLFLERLRFEFLGIKNFPVHLFLLIFLVWVNDTFAYIFGKAAGGPKLAPKISPNKTWAGTIGGITACVGFFFLLNYSKDFIPSGISDKTFYTALAVHIVVPIIAICGDLFESFLKRKAGVKDSGNIIPGHGGILDRVDGLILVMNVVGMIIYIMFSIRASQLAIQGVTI